MKVLVLLCSFLLVNSVYAQTDDFDAEVFGFQAEDNPIDSLDVTEESGIRRLVNRHISLNRRTDFKMTGWSVQLLVTKDRYEATSKKSEFIRRFPRIKAEWEYSEPYYRVAVGAYQTKLEATYLLHQIMSQYPNAYLVRNNKLRPRDFIVGAVN